MGIFKLIQFAKESAASMKANLAETRAILASIELRGMSAVATVMEKRFEVLMDGECWDEYCDCGGCTSYDLSDPDQLQSAILAYEAGKISKNDLDNVVNDILIAATQN